MMIIKEWRTGVAILFGLLLFLPVAQAEESFDCTHCRSWTITILSETEELTITSVEGKGIIMSNLPNKVFDNMTTHLITLSKNMAGKVTSLTYNKFMDPDGDFVIVETTSAPGETESNCKFLQGTGKWKGIKGSGKFRPITRGKPITPGTSQGCSRWTGTFELPK